MITGNLNSAADIRVSFQLLCWKVDRRSNRLFGDINSPGSMSMAQTQIRMRGPPSPAGMLGWALASATNPLLRQQLWQSASSLRLAHPLVWTPSNHGSPFPMFHHAILTAQSSPTAEKACTPSPTPPTCSDLNQNPGNDPVPCNLRSAAHSLLVCGCEHRDINLPRNRMVPESRHEPDAAKRRENSHHEFWLLRDPVQGSKCLIVAACEWRCGDRGACQCELHCRGVLLHVRCHLVAAMMSQVPVQTVKDVVAVCPP